MEGYLNMYMLPNTSKHMAQKKWFCLEKHGSVLQYAKSMHQPEHDDSISLEDCYCRLASHLLKRAEDESSFVLVTPQTQYLLVAGNAGLRDMWIEALALHGVPFEKQMANTERTFGEDLDVLTQRENTTVPRFFSNAIQYLTAHAMSDMNLFNTSPPQEETNRLKDMIDEGIDIDMAACSSVHVVAYLLLQFLLEIPTSLLTFYNYDKFVEAAGIADSSQRLASLKALMETLPQTHCAVLRQLVDFLSTFGNSHPSFAPVAGAIMRNADGKVPDAANVILNTFVANHRTLFPPPPTVTSPKPSTPVMPTQPRKAQMINIPRLSKIFRGAANSTSDLLAKVTNSPSRDKHAHHAAHANAGNAGNATPTGGSPNASTPSLASSPNAASSPIAAMSASPSPSPSASSPIGLASTSPSPSASSPIGIASASPTQGNPLNTSGNTIAASTSPPTSAMMKSPVMTTTNGAAKGSNAGAGAGADASAGNAAQKVVVLYGENFERKLEVDLCGENPWCTLRDFLSACEYDSGCLRSLTDPTVTIIADNFVVPPGTYQLQKPSRSGSFLSNRLKHLSIPINQIVKFADMQKAAMGVEESATAFKFPLNIQDSPPDSVTSVNPLGHLPRRTISRMPVPIARLPAPSRKPRISVPPNLIRPPSSTSSSTSTSPRSTTPTHFADSPEGSPRTNDSDYSPPSSPPSLHDPSLPRSISPRPHPPSRASRNHISLSQPLHLDDHPPFPSTQSPPSPYALEDPNDVTDPSFDPVQFRSSMHQRVRRIAPPRQSDVAEVQEQLKQHLQNHQHPDDYESSVSLFQKIVNSPSMNSLASIQNEPSPPRLRRVQTQPILIQNKDQPPTGSPASGARVTSPSPSPSPSLSPSLSSSPSPSPASALSGVVQRIIKAGGGKRDKEREKEREKKEKK